MPTIRINKGTEIQPVWEEVRLDEGTGELSHVEGEKTVAVGKATHAEGHYTRANVGYDKLTTTAVIVEPYSVTVADGSRFRVGDNIEILHGDFALATKVVEVLENVITIDQMPEFIESPDVSLPFAAGSDVFNLSWAKNYEAYGHAEGYKTYALGIASHAEGQQAQAIGQGSHAEGFSTKAIGYSSHVEGNQSISSGDNSHAEGFATKASGVTAHTEGNQTEATAENSHAEGYLSKASGVASHAEGQETRAIGSFSHAEGERSNASGNSSHAEGDRTVASGTSAHAEGSFTQATATGAHSEGAGTKASGVYSHAQGYSTTASGNNSHAEGESTEASGMTSHAEGYQTVAKGNTSHAEGSFTNASGQGSHAEGNNTQALGTFSHVEGDHNYAYGYASHIEGNENISGQILKGFESIDTATNTLKLLSTENLSDENFYEGEKVRFYYYNSTPPYFPSTLDTTITSIDIDLKTIKLSDQIPSLGTNPSDTYKMGMLLSLRPDNKADYSHIEGFQNIAKGKASHAEGNRNFAKGDYSHAEGSGTKASGESSHAEGDNSQANGKQSHAEGLSTIALGVASHAEGSLTRTNVVFDNLVSKSVIVEPYSIEVTTGTRFKAGDVIEIPKYSFTAKVLSVSGKMVTIDTIPGFKPIPSSALMPFAAGVSVYNLSSIYSSYGHAEGYKSAASGSASHAEGSETLAAGSSSHSEGYGTKATGSASHAEGDSTAATGQSSHSEGQSTTATGKSSHAEGENSKAIGNQSHAEGLSTYAIASGSHTEGLGTFAGRYYDIVAVDAANFKITTEYPMSLIGKGDTIAVIKNKNYETVYEFKVDKFDFANIWELTLENTSNMSNITVGSRLLPITLPASGSGAHAEGTGSIASARAAHAEGDSTIAYGVASHAEGVRTLADAEGSHAEGNGTIASAINSHAEGLRTVASGLASHAEGNATWAFSDGSHAEGYDTVAMPAIVFTTVTSRDYTNNTITVGLVSGFSEGDKVYLIATDQVFSTPFTIASTNGTTWTLAESLSVTSPNSVTHVIKPTTEANIPSHAEGRSTKAFGMYSHAEGYNSQATGNSAHAEGYGTVASGNYSHAEGTGAQARGIASHAEGNNTIASGLYSHAEGHTAMAQANYSHATGVYTNVSSAYPSAWIMGQYGEAKEQASWHLANGTGSGAKGLAARISTQGGMYTTKAYSTGGADYAEMFEWMDENKDNEDRVGYFVALDGDRIRVANASDNYILGVVSADPSVIGDNQDLHWKGRYLRDEWDRIKYHMVDIPAEISENIVGIDKDGNNVIETIEISPARKERQPMLNPDWDADQYYARRELRPEWSAIGMMGKLLVRDDGTSVVNGFVMPNDEGIATTSESGFRVMKRVSENIIQVLVK